MQNSKFEMQNLFNPKTVWIFLTAIVLLALVLRLWQLGSIPPSPDWDEAAFGYDAYSIMHTGRDEYGKFLPVVLRSFDDYKPALYAYAVIPAELVFGVNIFAVRFPSALFGVLTVLATYFLVEELTRKKSLALLSSFLLAISPWSIQFSRVGFESNVGVAMNAFTVLFFIKGMKKPWYFCLATFAASLNIYVYQSEKVFTPLLLLVLIFVYRRELWRVSRKYILAALLVGGIVILPMFVAIVTDKNVLLRVKGTSAFLDTTTFLQDDVTKLTTDHQNHDYLGLLLDNRRFVYTRAILDGYLAHYDMNWLFIKGDIARHHAPGMGLIYLVSLPFLLMGIYMVLFRRTGFDISSQARNLLLLWYLVTAIPASITSGVPHAVRTLNFLPVVEIFVAVGLLGALMYIKGKRVRTSVFILILAVYIFNVSYYLDQYFVQLNYYDSGQWQYGYAQAVQYVESVQDTYHKIIVSGKAPLDKSYMFFLFYMKYPPAEYQKVGQFSSGGFAETHAYGKFQFHEIDWKKESSEHNVLFVGNPGEFPANVNGVVKTINGLDGTPAIEIVSN